VKTFKGSMRIVEYDNYYVYSFGAASPINFPVIASVVTVGSFDGVHKGHKIIIDKLVAFAEYRHLRSVVVTFEPHPRTVLKDAVNGTIGGLLTTLDEKIDLLQQEGVDLVFVVRFTPDFAVRGSEDFITNVLVRLLGAKSIIIGYDHGFGNNRSGSGTTLEHLGFQLDFDVEVLDEVLIDQEHFSSTKIRELLGNGMIKDANKFLGYPYMITGIVVDGDKRGRKIGFPTVNLMLSNPDKLIPKAGVYFAQILLDGFPFKAIINIGIRPTITSTGIKTIEAYIVNYSGCLYGRNLRFSLLRFIREEKKFSSLEELKKQLEKDKKTVELYRL